MTNIVFLLLMLVSTPNQNAVKYNALIYPTEDHCMEARAGYMEAYEAKPDEYKRTMKTEAFCVPFDSFPIIGMASPLGA